jgi:type IV conjugative transfer system protein TraL
MNISEHRIIKTLDNPSRFLFWNVGECIMLALLLLIGGALESLIIMLSGVFYWFLFRKFKKSNREKGITPFHYFYWNFPTTVLRRSGNFSNIPCSHQRDIIL